VGATKPAHLADAIAAGGVRLTPEEVAALEAPYVPHAVTGVAPPLGAAPPSVTLVQD
jgi:hypothetical protein